MVEVVASLLLLLCIVILVKFRFIILLFNIMDKSHI